MNYVINGNIPSKKNSRITIKTGRSFPSKAYTKWHKEASKQIKTQDIPKEPLKHISEIIIIIYFPTLRKADITNKVESVMDLMVDTEILEDDNFFVVPKLIISGEYRKGLVEHK